MDTLWIRKLITKSKTILCYLILLVMLTSCENSKRVDEKSQSYISNSAKQDISLIDIENLNGAWELSWAVSEKVLIVHQSEPSEYVIPKTFTFSSESYDEKAAKGVENWMVSMPEIFLSNTYSSLSIECEKILSGFTYRKLYFYYHENDLSMDYHFMVKYNSLKGSTWKHIATYNRSK